MTAQGLELDEFGVAAGSAWESPRLSLKVGEGELVLVTAPVGGGKSLLARHLAGADPPGTLPLGTATLDGSSTAGPRTALAAQDARLSALSTDTVGSSVLDSLRRSDERARWGRASEILELAELRPADRFRRIQFRELSFGERRRAVLAQAVARSPRLLVGDALFEGVDDRGQVGVLRLLRSHLDRGGIALCFERSYPAYPPALLQLAREIIELIQPKSGVSSSVPPRSSAPPPETSKRPDDPPLLELEGLEALRGRGGLLPWQKSAHAVDGASLVVRHREVVALAGESGSGKTTLLETVAGLVPALDGHVFLEGRELTNAAEWRWRRSRRKVQLVFQEAQAALAPHRTVRALITEASELLPKNERETAPNLLRMVGLSPRLLEAPADQLSAGEAQRVDLARSLALKPDLILLDAPSVGGLRADGMDLPELLAERKRLGTSFLIAFQTLRGVEHVADQIAIMLSGRIVEWGPAHQIMVKPYHPYTRALVDAASAAVSSERGELSSRRLQVVLDAPPPDPRRPVKGCPHFARCASAEAGRCDTVEPSLVEVGPHHHVACHHPLHLAREVPSEPHHEIPSRPPPTHAPFSGP